MHTLRIPVVKMRAHDAERQVLLDALIELGASKPVAQRLLPGDEGKVFGRNGGLLGVSRRLADTHVEDDLLDRRHLHGVLVAELLDELRPHDLLVVLF